MTPRAIPGFPSPATETQNDGIVRTAVWTGRSMILWGGWQSCPAGYDPVAQRWSSIGTNGAPKTRLATTAVWTGQEMIVWGGVGDGRIALNDGGRYSPISDSWTLISTNGSPLGRLRSTAVWTGNEMIVWGGAAGPDQGAYQRLISE